MSRSFYCFALLGSSAHLALDVDKFNVLSLSKVYSIKQVMQRMEISSRTPRLSLASRQCPLPWATPILWPPHFKRWLALVVGAWPSRQNE